MDYLALYDGIRCKKIIAEEMKIDIHSIVGWGLYHIYRPFKGLSEVSSIYFHNPTPAAFERVIKWAKKQGYTFIRISDMLEYMRSGEKAKGRQMLVTFDDAWRSNLDLIPIIEKYQVPITIFAPITPLQEGNYWWEYAQKAGGRALSDEMKTYDENRFLEKVRILQEQQSVSRSAMTMEELKQLSQHPLVDIGSHSFTHPILTNISDISLERELRESQQYLQDYIEKPVRFFCYPNGSLTLRETERAKTYYDCAFSTIQDNPKVGGDMYSIPRYALTDNYWSNLAKIIGVWKKFV